MYFKSKYIVSRDGTPVVFAEVLTHADVARALFGNTPIIGAGFCYIKDNRYVCYGESVSLRVISRGEQDAEMLNRYLGAVVDDL